MPVTITEKGVLPVGIERDGKFHREFEIRPALVGDSIEVADEHEPKKLTNRWYANICLAAKQIIRIGDISPVPFKDVVKMLDVDMEQIYAAQERLAMRLSRFHDSGKDGEQATPSNNLRADGTESAQAGPGLDEASLHDGSSSPDDAGKSL
ncbi:MAG: hypothetical protein ACLQVJ_10420 [Syntrophobacteraceae bacterium]